MKDLKIEASGDTKILEIRTGEALPLQEPKKVSVVGVISSVSTFLEKRLDLIIPDECHVNVDRDDMTIGIVVDEHSYYSDSIIGKISMNKN